MKTLSMGLSVKSAGPNLSTFTVSSRSLDRQGDILEPSGIDTRHFMLNPCVLWSHSYSALPIGRARAIRATLDDRIEADVEFAPTEFAQQVKTLVDEGFMRATSVGFQPIKSEPLDGGGTRYLKWSLLEVSLVNVPANAESLIVAAKGKGLTVGAIEQALRPHWISLAGGGFIELGHLVREVTRDLIKQTVRRRSGPIELSSEEQDAIRQIAARIKPPRP